MEETCLEFETTGGETTESAKQTDFVAPSSTSELQLGQPHKLPHVIHAAETREVLHVSIIATELSSLNSFSHAT